MENETAVFTNMVMIYDSGGNVVVQDRKSSFWAGAAFPGGHVEHGESFVDAAVREVYEETGLTVSKLQLCGIQDWVQDNGSRYVVFMYKTNEFKGELRSSDEGEVRWVSLNELPNLNLASGFRTILKLFCSNTFSELFYDRKNGGWAEVFK